MDICRNTVREWAALYLLLSSSLWPLSSSQEEIKVGRPLLWIEVNFLSSPRQQAMVDALVLYCHRANSHKCSRLKQHTFIISQFLKNGNLGMVYMCSLSLVSHLTAIKLWAVATVSSEGSTGEGSPSPWLLAWFSPSWAIGLKVFILCRLLARNYHGFLPAWTFPTWQLIWLKNVIQASNGKSPICHNPL